MISSKRLLGMSQKKALHIFKVHAKNVPFYRKFLQESNVQPEKIRTIDDFIKLVPVLDKDRLFISNLNNVDEILSGHGLRDCQAILPSSGFSGKFSFGINTKNDVRSQEKHVDMMLDHVFDVRHKRTLLINSLSMGIAIPTAKVTTISTGPRTDIVISAVKAFSSKFDQTIIVGDNCLLKNAIERGIEDGIKWHEHATHLILGGDSFPENFRSYMAHLMKVNIDREQKIIIGSSFGIAEIGLNILWETPNTVGIRRAASLDSKFRTALLGREEELCPMLFYYHPLKIHVEEVHDRLVFTNLDTGALTPIVRYASGDHGLIIPYERIVKVLKAVGLERYIPLFSIPIVAVKDRVQYINFEGRIIFPSIIKNALYSDFGLPGFTTGYFRVTESNGKLILEIQLKQGVTVSEEIKKRFEISIASYIRNVNIELKFYPYREFQYGMGLDYERKFVYMLQCNS
jgi:phenylacetate-CoA ligase